MADKIRLNEELLNYAVIGGTILGGGGGGAKEPGLSSGKVAIQYGQPELIDINDIPENTVVVSGSPCGYR